MLDAVIVGSGPNGLSAAVALAEAGKRVLVIEGRDTIGGGTRTEQLTEPGVLHDVCSSVHPLGAGSPFFNTLPLVDYGLEWGHAPIPFAHAMADGDSVLVHRSLADTVAGLGEDGPAWRSVFGPFVQDWARTVRLATAPPMRAALSPIAGLRLARYGLRSGEYLAGRFATDRGRAVIAGLAAHAIAPLDTPTSGGVALLLGAAAHAVGWPFAVGGSASISKALAAYLVSLGGEIETGRWVRVPGDLPEANVVLLDTSLQAASVIAGDRLSARRRRRYEQRPTGPGSLKVDFATSGPVPWLDKRLGDAGTVHLGGTFEEIAAAEAQVSAGGEPERPFVLVSQPLSADRSRAPEGTGVLWAYCHVARGAGEESVARIIAQIERFAPGFRSTIRSTSVRGPHQLEEANPNYVGGDITGGPISLWGTLARPSLFRPHRAGPRLFLCSAATAPGAGVHGMCGFHAARAALSVLD